MLGFERLIRLREDNITIEKHGVKQVQFQKTDLSLSPSPLITII